MSMFKSALKLFSVAVLLAALAACTSDGSNGMNDDDDETPIALADMPAPVRSAILALTPEQNITQLSTEIENGATVYEVEYTANGQAREAEFNARGETLADDDDDDGDEEEDDDDDDDGEDDD